MIRALMTVLVASLIVIAVGPPLLLLGCIYPSRRLMACSSYWWASMILWMAGVRLTVEGKQHIAGETPRFFMGNHQSALDIPILIAALRGDVRFMGKNTLFRIPVFGWVMHRYGYVPIHRSHPRVTLQKLDEMLARVREKPISLAVFPEGTRTRDGRLLPFRKGTMKIGRRAGLAVVPFSIEGSLAVNHRDEFRAVPGPVRLTFSQPIPVEEVAAMSPIELHDRVREAVSRGLVSPSSPTPRDDAPLFATEGT